jgi:translation initiation factor 1 (eIF-1/SUI1)
MKFIIKLQIEVKVTLNLVETQTQQLAAGKYVAVVQSFANFDTGIKSTVNMVIRSSSKIEVSSKDISESNMHKSLVLFLLKEGTVEPDWVKI